MLGRYTNAHFRCGYLFFEKGPFLCPFKITKHYKNRVFASKGCFTICDTWKLCCAESTIVIVFSAQTQICRNKKCKLTNNRYLPKIGGCLPTCKWSFLFFLFFFSLCFCSFVLYKGLKRIFSYNFTGVIFSLFTRNSCLKNPFFLPILLFSLAFLLSSLSDLHIVSLLFVHPTPF